MAQFRKDGLTFDDVLLIPQSSDVLPRDIDTTTQITNNINLKLPILSAAMDTVTESHMAIKMACLGGIGIIHKNMTIEEQANQVSKVKKHINGFISDPITLKKDSSLAEAEQLMHEYKISGIPIVDDDNKLIGIITNRDLRYEKRDQRPISDFMTKDNLIVGYTGISISAAKDLIVAQKIEKLPIVDEQFHLVGYITSKDIDNIENYPDATKDKSGRLVCGGAIGYSPDIDQRIEALLAADVDVLVFDSAHGHSKLIVDKIAEIKQNYPEVEIIAGNIVTKEACIDLARAGVSAVKVGIGPGSICTTRIISGVGCPQITAIDEVCSVAKDLGVYVIADGGIKYSGDITKALACGADAVMLGSLLAGTDESPGEIITLNGTAFKSYVGMGSLEAMKRGSKDRYFQKNTDTKNLISEGVSGQVAYKGSVEHTIYQLIGGVRSGMGYCGCQTLKQLHERAIFQQISAATLAENHPHTITITKEQPNYQRK